MNSTTLKEAYARLFNSDSEYDFKIRFSRKFSPYNANVKKVNNVLVFSFSPEWKNVSDEIGIGMVQELLQRILRKKAALTTNIELYNHFIKNLHLSAAKTEADERLQQIFERVNSRFFNNSLDQPNLRWGITSKTRLATYDYHTDTINVSTLFKDADEEILSYLLYHEMLHKKLKFESGKRTIHHGKKFRMLEKKFPDYERMEEKLTSHIRCKSRALQKMSF